VTHSFRRIILRLPRRAFFAAAVTLFASLEQLQSGPINPNNILVSIGIPLAGSADAPEQNTVREFTLAGSLVQIIPFKYGDRKSYLPTEYMRDIAVDQYGEICAYNGTFFPFLTRYSPNTNTFKHRPFPGWSTVNSPNLGAIATFQKFVFVTDYATYNGGSSGIIRVDRTDNSWVRFAAGTMFIDINVGLDGNLYGIVLNPDFDETLIRVYDPLTLALLRTIAIPAIIVQAGGASNIAVDGGGRMFLFCPNGVVYRLNSSGVVEASRYTGFTQVTDMDIDEKGRLILAQYGGRVIIGNSALTTFSSFLAVNNPEVLDWAMWVSFAHAVPPPLGVVPTPTPTPTPPPLPLAKHNIFVSTGQDGSFVHPLRNMVAEFSPTGVFARRIRFSYNNGPYPNSPDSELLAAITVDDRGTISAFNGIDHPFLTRYFPDTKSFTNEGLAGWNGHYGASIAAFKDWVFVNDGDNTNNPTGLIRFNTINGDAVRFATRETGPGFSPVNVGLNGNIYALFAACGYFCGGPDTIDVYDPATLVQKRQMPIPSEIVNNENISGVAADAAGNIFLCGAGGGVYELDATGMLVNSFSTGYPYLTDIQVDETGRLVLAHNGNDVRDPDRILLADTTLNYDRLGGFNAVLYTPYDDGVSARISFGPLSPIPAPTPAALATDFNGDGKPDFLLHYPTGATNLWYLNNNIYLAGGAAYPAYSNFVGVADFNRDGSPDYAIFEPDSHDAVIVYLAGGSWLTNVTLFLPPDWDLNAVGDFNRDGYPDFVLVNPSARQTAIWFLTDGVLVGGAYGPTLPPGWKLVAVADFNRDGDNDYLLFNPSTRQSAIWYLSGAKYVGGAFGPTIASGYILKGTADFNGDGKPDYLLYNPTTQRTALWYLDNNILTAGAYGPTLPSGWQLLAP